MPDPPDLRRGHLPDRTSAPATGERFDLLVRTGGLEVEHILSGVLDGPADYLQDHDELVVVLAGGAEMEVDGRPVTVATGDWLLLPAGVPHRVVRTEPGTSWLAVHHRCPAPGDPGRAEAR